LTAIVTILLISAFSVILVFGLLGYGKLFDRMEMDSQFKRRSLTIMSWIMVFCGLTESICDHYLNRNRASNAASPLDTSQIHLLRRVAPVYPEIAKQARVQGKVRFHAVVNSTGQIEKLSLISGNPMLIPAAKDAILQWQYSAPPANLETVVEVNFTLNPAN